MTKVLDGHTIPTYMSKVAIIRIGYTLGSQCIPGIYARWFLITHEGVISKPPRVFPGIHGYLINL